MSIQNRIIDERLLNEQEMVYNPDTFFYVFSKVPEARRLADILCHIYTDIGEDSRFLGYIEREEDLTIRMNGKKRFVVIVPYNSGSGITDIERLNKVVEGNIFLTTGYAFYISIAFNIRHFSEEFKEWFYWKGKQIEVIESLNARYKEISDMSSDNPVLVYSCQKTGTYTVYDSLKAAGFDAVHTHHFMGWTNDRDDWQGSLGRAKEYWKNKILSRDSIKIISCIRDPIDRNLSYCFQSTDNYHMFHNANDYNGFWDYVNKSLSVDTDGVCGRMALWFDMEIKKAFGLDVMTCDFDRENGFGIVRRGNTELLILSLEKMINNEKIIADFVGAKDFSLIKSNVGEKKSYRYVYDLRYKHINIEKSLLKYYYNDNPFLNHFYTPGDLAGFRKKWETYCTN